NPYYAFAVDGTTPDAISVNLTDVVSASVPVTYSLLHFEPPTSGSWSWLDQSAMPVLTADAAAINNVNDGTYTALVELNGHVVSAVAFTILGDDAQEFDITDPGQVDSGTRGVGDLIVVNNNITGTVTAGGGDDVMWIQPGIGSHSLDGGTGSDALY